MERRRERLRSEPTGAAGRDGREFYLTARKSAAGLPAPSRAARPSRLGPTIRGPPSLADPELFGHGPIALHVLLSQILQEAAALADQHQQAPAGVVVVLVGLEVVGQPVDALGQERDLNFGRARVAVVCLELLDETLLLLQGQPHAGILPGVPPPIATPPGPRLRLRWDGFVEV